jgi:hypothetical protein
MQVPQAGFLFAMLIHLSSALAENGALKPASANPFRNDLFFMTIL